MQKEIPKVKVDNTKPDFWIKKHKQDAKVKKEAVPPVGTYKNYPVTFDTFGKLLAQAKDKPVKSAVKYLGTEDRFKDPKKSKSLMKMNVPGAGAYPLIAQWPGNAAVSVRERDLGRNTNEQELVSGGTQGGKEHNPDLVPQH